MGIAGTRLPSLTILLVSLCKIRNVLLNARSSGGFHCCLLLPSVIFLTLVIPSCWFCPFFMWLVFAARTIHSTHADCFTLCCSVPPRCLPAGQLVAYPLELVSRHMQVAASNPAAHQLASRNAAAALSRHTAFPVFAKVQVPRALARALIRGGGPPAGLSMTETIRHIVAQRGVAGLYQVRHVPPVLSSNNEYSVSGTHYMNCCFVNYPLFSCTLSSHSLPVAPSHLPPLLPPTFLPLPFPFNFLLTLLRVSCLHP